MEDKAFFKSTPLYKEYVILDLIQKNSSITQRKIGDHLKISVSTVNNYLDMYEKSGYLVRDYKTRKTIDYLITNKGTDRKKF